MADATTDTAVTAPLPRGGKLLAVSVHMSAVSQGPLWVRTAFEGVTLADTPVLEKALILDDASGWMRSSGVLAQDQPLAWFGEIKIPRDEFRYQVSVRVRNDSGAAINWEFTHNAERAGRSLR